MDRNMDKVKEFYDKYKVYLTRQNLELLAVTVIVLSAILVFTSGIPGKGVLTLDQGKIKYDGTMTFQNGDSYSGQFRNGIFDGKGTFTSQAGWKYEGDFSKGQADGQGKLTTEGNVVYEGTFKQGIYQNAH